MLNPQGAVHSLPMETPVALQRWRVPSVGKEEEEVRIAMLAPVDLRVPPVAYGGIEMVVSLLTEELIRRGHEVTLFASGDSVTSARLESVCDGFLRGSGRDQGIFALLNVVSCLERADEFDLIHNHTDPEGMTMAGMVKTPMLTTLHGSLLGDRLLLFHRYKGWYNAISRSAKSLLPPKDKFAGVIYNAIDCNSYPFNGRERDGYLLFLSRISPEKGTHIAIEVARRLNRRLIIAGNVDESSKVDQEYLEALVLPQVDGDQIQYVGETDQVQKRQLLSRAQCLLAPITWPEPFGLFMVEAMACGTPVVAFNRGSAPEVVQHGVTGFVVNSLEEMVDAVGQVHLIDPKRCREHVKQTFDVPRMADDYLAAYARTMKTESLKASKPTNTIALERLVPYELPELDC